MTPFLLFTVPLLDVLTGTSRPLPPPRPAAAVVVDAPATEQPAVPTRAWPRSAGGVGPSLSGHYDCPGSEAEQFTVPCVRTTVVDPGPSGGDDPATTMAGTHPDYGARLEAEFCWVKPWLCDHGWLPGTTLDRHAPPE